MKPVLVACRFLASSLCSSKIMKKSNGNLARSRPHVRFLQLWNRCMTFEESGGAFPWCTGVDTSETRSTSSPHRLIPLSYIHLSSVTTTRPFRTACLHSCTVPGYRLSVSISASVCSGDVYFRSGKSARARL